MRARLIGLSLGWLLAASTGLAATIELDRPAGGSLQSAGFELDRPAEVRIAAVAPLNPDRRGWLERVMGLGEDGDDTFFVHAALLDADSRATLWRLSADDARRESGNLMSAGTTLRLPAGRYEIHLIALARDGGRRGPFGRGGIDDADLREGRVEVEIGADAVRRFEPDGRRDGALVAIGPVPNRRLERAGFELAREGTLRVVAIIEHDGEAPADYGWIADAGTGQAVWLPTVRELRPAGGAAKNRRVDETVSLPAGRYVLAYGTDDSHAIDGFNAAPPDDPLGWGIAVVPGADFDRAAFSTFDPTPPGEPRLGWSRVGDDAILRQAFRLARDGVLRIEASGEAVGDSAFVDDARIVDAVSGATVWRLTARNTVAAGGAAKNRRFAGTVRLPAGVYELRYTSDDSHAFGDWNAALPFDPAGWGVRVWPGPGLDADAIEPLEPGQVAAAAG